MRIFLDTEFIDDGSTIDLISIGLYAENGSTYYAVSCEFDWDKAWAHSWLPANVLSHLPLFTRGNRTHLDVGAYEVKDRATIATEVKEFITSRGPAELWANYSAYDHVALAQLFGTMVDLPKGIPMRTRDLQCFSDFLGRPEVPKQTGTEHHALEDARHDYEMWRHLSMVQRWREMNVGEFCECDDGFSHRYAAKLAYKCTSRMLRTLGGES